jgi:hypothetical protein
MRHSNDQKAPPNCIQHSQYNTDRWVCRQLECRVNARSCGTGPLSGRRRDSNERFKIELSDIASKMHRFDAFLMCKGMRCVELVVLNLNLAWTTSWRADIKTELMISCPIAFIVETSTLKSVKRGYSGQYKNDISRFYRSFDILKLLYLNKY